MRLFRTLALTGLLAVAGTACADLEVTNLNDPDRARAISTPSDVEALISGSFSTWWGVVHYSYPSSALSVGADAHSSSWGNWGMRDFGEEPRKAFNNQPTYSYNNVAETAWQDLYGALAAVRDGVLAIDGGIEIGEAGADTPRAMAFAKLVQGLSLAYIGLLYDKGFVVDESTDLAAIEFVPYTDVFAAGMQKLAEAESLAGSNSFTIPELWVGDGGDWDSGYMQRFIRSYRARLVSQVGRTAAERDAANWSAIMADAQNGLGASESYFGDYDGSNWAWMRQKLHTAGISGWTRIDYRTVGPADVSGNYAAWLSSSPDNKLPFNIDTDDSRVTGGAFDADGGLINYIGSSPFPADRGIYHYSHYISGHWTHLSTAGGFVGIYPDFVPFETDFLMAEAMFRLGDKQGALDIVNASRAGGGLAPIADVNGSAPGGARCIPRNDGSTCANLWEALKYEKRLVLFHYGLATEYFDDRGWGDLVSGTPMHLPVPGKELELLLEEIYSFGGAAGGGAPSIIYDLSPEALKIKRVAFERYREAVRADESLSPIVH